MQKGADNAVNDLLMHLMELSSQGFFCSQILLMLRLEAEGKENPDLVRALGGLAGGLGFNGKACGALTGGACMIAYYASKGSAEEMAGDRLNGMIASLIGWFDEEVGGQYGGTDCAVILGGDMANRKKRCPQIVEGVYNKAMEILNENGYDLM